MKKANSRQNCPILLYFWMLGGILKRYLVSGMVLDAVRKAQHNGGAKTWWRKNMVA